MTNILVTGSNGQLGNEINLIRGNYDWAKFFFTDVAELDITNAEKVEEYIKKNKINCVVNCAAYTAVDKAESEKKDVIALNSTAVKNLAEITAKYNVSLVHISTDYVFEGKNFKPYTESDTANPKTIYGKAKLDGEIEMLFNAKNAVIIRTSWLYSSFGNNFVKTILQKSKENKSLKVVFDQIGTPTFAGDLAAAIMQIIPKLSSIPKVEIYNYSNEGVCSWYDFALEIVEFAGTKCEIIPIETKEYPTPALRPHFSVLNKTKIKKDFGITIPHWKESLRKCLQLIK